VNRIVKASGLLLLGLIVGGCVSLTTQQQQRLDDIQQFADRTTAVYGLPSVRISVQRASNLNIGGVYRQGNIFLNVQMLDAPRLTILVAHELGHYVLGHDSIIPQAASQADWQRAQQKRELDANAKAVEILVRAQGLSENAALQMMVDALRKAEDAQMRGAPLTPGHLSPSAELADLLARFPAAAALPR
jgi:Zn-dependent peptidase ImmA (M78 family)